MWDRGMPALLLSFPGSGNTWVRLLLEYATGYCSSTIYWDHDKELQKVFKAEEKCGLRQIVHKAHPEDLVWRGFMDRANVEIKGPTALRSSNKHVRRKCDRSFVRHWDKILLLVRDPYRSILSDYQRMVTNSHVGAYDPGSGHGTPIRLRNQGDGGGSERKTLTAKDFWLIVAKNKALSYRDKFDDILYPILRNPNPDPGALMPLKHPLYNVSMGVVRYEILTDSDPERREEELARAVRMLNVSTHTDRIRCAFVLADDSRIRRGAGTGPKLNMTVMYGSVQANLSLVLWEHLSGFATNFSYHQWNND